jgi:hypothetical protein
MCEFSELSDARCWEHGLYGYYLEWPKVADAVIKA